MKGLLLGLSMAVLVTARPELYREKEDFQYSRSSSDEGSKSGYYDAQRGNMGGNYERAHNMDGLAQHQMGGLVKQVEGELGDGAKTRSGSVFTAANSQGMYGSGRYDLSSLAGRNFQEGTSFHDSQSYLAAGSRAHSSQYSALNNARYNTDSQSRSSGFGDFHKSDNLQEAQNSYGAREYERGSQSQHSSKYYSQSGYQGSSDYERSNINHQATDNFGADTHNRLISQVPVRIVVRPGTRVAIPLATQTHSGSHAASYDQSNTNSEAEVLSSGDQQTAFRPSGDAKHYESSYSYRKEWEKHDTKPVTAVPVVPIAKNSQLYDESQLHHGSGYTQNTDYNLASSQVRQQAGFNSQHSALSSESQHQAEYNARQQSASSNLNSNAYSHSGYNSDANSHSANLIGTITSKPKSYQSSYAYHKSWERQGDPYVIIPPSNGAYDGQASQRLTDLSGSQGEYSLHNYGSKKSHQTYSIKDCVIECDPNSHIRVARSLDNARDGQEALGQQSQSGWEEVQNLAQQSQNLWDNSGQQTQNKWDNLEDLGQQTQNTWGNLEQLGQQTQNTWEQQAQDAGQQVQNKWDNLEQLGQQTQNKWEQQIQDAGQQVQNKWDNLEQLGQQTQNKWEQQIQDAGQQVQNKWDNLEQLGQQTQNKWEQQTQDAGQEVQNKWDKLEDLGQQTQNKWEQSQDGGQLTENKWDLGQQAQSQLGVEKNTGQEILNGWNNLEAFGQQSEKGQDQQTQDNWDTQKQEIHTNPIEIEELGQHTQQAQWDPLEEQNQAHQVPNSGTQQKEYEKFDKSQSSDNQDSFGWWPNQHNPQEQQSQTVDLNQQSQGFDLDQTQKFDNQNVFEQTIQDKWKAFQPEDLSQQTQGFWNHFENEFSNNHGFHSNGNIESNKPQTNTQGSKNTGSVNSLWGKLGDLDEDIVPSSVNAFQTQNTDFSQTSSSQSSQQNWHQESLFNYETSSKVAEIDNHHYNHHLDDFDKWSLTNKGRNNTDPLSNTFTHKIDDFDEKSTTENTLLVTGLTTDGKKITTTTEKPQNEDNTRTLDFGRGDIGPEDDSLIYLSKSTTEKTTEIDDDNFSHKYTTENDDNNQFTTPNEKDDNSNFLLTQEVMNEPTRIFIPILNEQTSPEPFHFKKTTQKPNKDDSQNFNKPSDKPFNQVGNDEVPEEIEQQFETQNIQQVNQLHNEQKFDYFEQNKFQHQSSDQEQQNTELENFGRENPNGDITDQQFVDFSQMNQQWHSEQRNIQQQFPDDFYQQNQYPQLQNSYTGDFEQHNAESTLADFGQQNVKSEFEILPENEQQEKKIKKDYVEDIGQQPNKNNMLEKDVTTIPAAVTEKPSVWKSIDFVKLYTQPHVRLPHFDLEAASIPYVIQAVFVVHMGNLTCCRLYIE